MKNTPSLLLLSFPTSFPLSLLSYFHPFHPTLLSHSLPLSLSLFLALSLLISRLLSLPLDLPPFLPYSLHPSILPFAWLTLRTHPSLLLHSIPLLSTIHIIDPPPLPLAFLPFQSISTHHFFISTHHQYFQVESSVLCGVETILKRI